VGAVAAELEELHVSVTWFNALSRAEAERALLACCAAPRWAAEVVGGRPYGDAEALVAAADLVREEDVDPALTAHPRIGQPTTGQSRREQSGVQAGDAAELAEGNRRYEERFGHIFLICATGLSGAQMLAALRRRLANDPATERAVVRDELRKITALRLQALARDGG
jgi:2-oxo-4-hydroxy-4-carboxy-5-ureidoimidazoline decarboxylase